MLGKNSCVWRLGLWRITRSSSGIKGQGGVKGILYLGTAWQERKDVVCRATGSQGAVEKMASGQVWELHWEGFGHKCGQWGPLKVFEQESNMMRAEF